MQSCHPTPAQIIRELQASANRDGLIAADDLPEQFEHVEDGDWSQDLKYQFATDIVKHVPTGLFFALDQARTGSYHTDWDYSPTTVRQVQKKEITTHTWVSV